MQLVLTLKIIYIAAGLISIISLLIGFDFIRSGRKSPYFRIRQKRVGSGWRMIGASILFGAVSFFAMRYGSFTPTLSPEPAIITPAATVTLAIPTAQKEFPSPVPTRAVSSLPTLEVSSFPTLSISETASGTLQSKSTPITSKPTVKTTKSLFTSTITRTPTITRTITVSPTASKTRTSWPSFTPSRTWTPRPTYPSSRTPTITVTRVDTLTPTITNTRAPTNTETPTLTSTPTRTASPTSTITPQPSLTFTATNTLTPTSTFTATATNTRAPTKVETSGTVIKPVSTYTSKPETLTTLTQSKLAANPIFTPTIAQLASTIPSITLTGVLIQSPEVITSSLTPASEATSLPTGTNTRSSPALSQLIMICLILLVLIPLFYVLIKNYRSQ